ncbi:Catalase [Luteitalea pratensis]|uniref:Catalase n=1 Tax=Luteitalea pratensis TaxID=1855912 RepID=A0A143PSN3_LUTPR|nr:hypothetical protein [Luteitalea pratensis]AMY10849.1 Catalase [Luteitalea pratensis]
MIEPLSPVAGVENVPQGETEQIEEIAGLMRQLLEKRYGSAPPCLRGVHPKAHGCARATLTVNADLPDGLRVGLFADAGASYEAVVRFSNAAALVGPDCQDTVKNGVLAARQHGSRGMAVKIFGVPGEGLTDDEPHTQDLLMVNFQVFPFANVADYLVLTRLQLRAESAPPSAPSATAGQDVEPDNVRLFKAFGAELVKTQGGALRATRAREISTAIQSSAMTDPVSSKYFSAAPFMFGTDRVMKFSVRPEAPAADTPLADTLDPDYLRTALANRLRATDVSFELAVQVREPSQEAAIEDVTHDWADVAYQPVARIITPKQDTEDMDLRQRCETLFFTPWHSLIDHRPVGGINRLRLAVYRASVERRRQ